MPMQKRWKCGGCQREWAHATQFDDEHCPICGSADIERVTFQGLFDIDTPPDVMARLTAEVGAGALELEHETRQKAVAGKLEVAAALCDSPLYTPGSGVPEFE